MLNSLKIERDKINKYDENIENLKKVAQTTFDKKKKFFKRENKTGDKDDLTELPEKSIDDEDILLEECVTNNEEESSDEENDENKFRSVKVIRYIRHITIIISNF